MTAEEPVRVLVVEDHGLLADSLAAALVSEGYVVDCPDDLDPAAVLERSARFRPHVALLDLRLDDDATALPMIEPLRDIGASVVMVTSEKDPVALAECVEAGAIGLVHKSQPFDELVDTVRHVAELRTGLSPSEREDLLALLRQHRREEARRHAPFERLTPREREVLAGLMDGLSAEALAERDYVSIATVRSQIRAVLTKLGVSSQLAAVALARAASWRPGQAG